MVVPAKEAEGVVHSLRVGEARVAQAAVRRFEGDVPEDGGGLDPAGMLEGDHNPDHNLPAGRLGEVGHSQPGAHILQADLDREENFLEGEYILQVGDHLVGWVLIVNWEAAVGVAASGVAQSQEDLGDH